MIQIRKEHKMRKNEEGQKKNNKPGGYDYFPVMKFGIIVKLNNWINSLKQLY